MVKVDRMGIAGVGPPEDDQVRLLDLLVRTRAPARPEHCRQTDDTRCVSSAVATVDIVRADDGSNKFLRSVVEFVRCLRTTEHAERPGGVSVNRVLKRARGYVHCMIPGRRLQRPVPPYKRLRESGPSVRTAGHEDIILTRFSRQQETETVLSGCTARRQVGSRLPRRYRTIEGSPNSASLCPGCRISARHSVSLSSSPGYTSKRVLDTALPPRNNSNGKRQLRRRRPWRHGP